MKKFVLVLSLMLGLLPGVSQALPDNLWYLASRQNYITWASARVAGGDAYISGNVVNSTNSSPFVDVTTNALPKVVLSALASKLVSFEPLNTNDQFSAVISLRDADWHTLFMGVNPFQLTKASDGNWVLPSGVGAIHITDVYYWAEIPVGTDVYAAGMYVRDQNGKQVGFQWFNVNNGVMEFATPFLGGGEILLYTPTGSVAFDLRHGGQRITMNVVSMNLTGDMSALVTEVSETVGSIVDNPVSQNGVGLDKPYELTVTAKRTINVSGSTTEGEPATQVIVVNMDTKVMQKINIGSVPAKVDFDPGTYQLDFIWRDGFGTYRPTAYDSGKGG